jgi:two-component system NtrC family sensor kinase
MHSRKSSSAIKGKRTLNPLVPIPQRNEAEMFRSLVESGDEGMLVFNEQGRIEYANRMASEITGYSKAELLKMTVSSLLGPSHPSLLEDCFGRVEPQDEKICRDIQFLTPGGSLKETEVCVSLIVTSQGERKAYTYLRDITESKKREQAIRETYDQFEKIAEMGEDGILVCDQAYRILFSNQMASEITGIPRDKLIGRNLFEVVGKEDKEFLGNTVLRGLGTVQKLCAEMSILTPQGRVKDTEVCIASDHSNLEQGRTYAYIRDITEKKRCEKELKESVLKHRTLFERVRHGLFFSSKEGKFLDCNQALLDLLGYTTQEEFSRIDIARDLYVNPEDRRIFQEKIEKDGFVKDMEVEFKKKNGEKITMLLTGHAVRNGKGEITGYEGINLDISERKRIENELREANRFFMNLIQSSVDGIIAADMKGNIFIFNRGAEALTGYRADEVIGKIHITEIYPERVAKEVMNKLRSPEYGGVGKLTPIQFHVLNKNGEGIPIQLSATLIYDEAGNEAASVGIFTDLRPRLRMEKKLQETHLQLVSSEKMASLGKLAAGIAHEINNPLGGILIYSSLMMEDLPEEDPRRQDLARIVQETSRCKDIVKSLLEFARQTEPNMEPTDINRAITEGLFFLENQALFHNIQIIKRLDSGLPLVVGNAGHLKQVFMNIIVNAAEAMRGGGTLTIATSYASHRNMVFVEFTDTGEGIPEENLTRIFDPFFTTKDIGKGTGLGLSTSYGIVESHGGRISVKSKVGKGSTFTIELPVHSGQKPA